MKLIAHLDMDAFYASVALLRYPELRGKAVVIGGGQRHKPEDVVDDAGNVTRKFATLRGYAGRGVILTATYEARALGLRSALGLMKAAAIAPDVILLPSDFDAYRRYSRLFKSAVAAIAPRIEDRGIDEIYIDLTRRRPAGCRARDADESDVDAWWRARDVAKSLKAAVHEATGLTCSIAVAPNKLLAKIASELDKPDGLTILKPEDVAIADMAAAAFEDQRHRTQGEPQARCARHSHHRRARARRPRVARRAFRAQLRGVAPARGAR